MWLPPFPIDDGFAVSIQISISYIALHSEKRNPQKKVEKSPAKVNMRLGQFICSSPLAIGKDDDQLAEL